MQIDGWVRCLKGVSVRGSGCWAAKWMTLRTVSSSVASFRLISMWSPVLGSEDEVPLTPVLATIFLQRRCVRQDSQVNSQHTCSASGNGGRRTVMATSLLACCVERRRASQRYSQNSATSGVIKR